MNPGQYYSFSRTVAETSTPLPKTLYPALVSNRNIADSANLRGVIDDIVRTWMCPYYIIYGGVYGTSERSTGDGEMMYQTAVRLFLAGFLYVGIFPTSVAPAQMGS